MYHKCQSPEKKAFGRQKIYIIACLHKIPLYLSSGLICLEICWTCNSNLTRSIGATVVFDTAAEIPPAKKSLAKATGSAKAGIICVSFLVRAMANRS